MSQAGLAKVSSGSLPPSVPLQFTTDSGIAFPALNNINIFGNGSATTEATSLDTITIRVVNDGFLWSEQSVDFSAQIQNGYFLNAALIVTLPDSAGLITGNTIIIFNDVAATCRIQTAAGQRVEIGNITSIVNGTARGLQQGCTVQLVFKASDLTWHAISNLGVWLVT